MVGKGHNRQIRRPSRAFVARIDRIDLQMSLLALIWGSAFLGIKVLGAYLDPFQMTWFRYLPFPILYGAYIFAKRRGVLRQVEGKHWILMAVLGFIGVVGYHFPLNWGLHGRGADQVTGATGSILIATNPLWTLAIAVLRRKERLHLQSALGFLVAFAGVAIVILFGHGAATISIAGKALIILLAPMCWAIYSIYSKPLVERYGGLFVTGVTLSLGAFTLLPIGISYGTAPLRTLNGEAWAWLLFLAFLSTAAGYAIWNDSLRYRKASEVAVFVYAQPVVTAVLAYLYLDDPLTPWFLGGSALVLAGVIQVNRARLKLATQTPAAGAAVSKP